MSPPSITSVNCSPGTTCVSVMRIGSPSGPVMVKLVPSANGPSMVTVTTPTFQVGQDATSDHCHHRAAADAPVSTECSYSHIATSKKDCEEIIYAETISGRSRAQAQSWVGGLPAIR